MPLNLSSPPALPVSPSVVTFKFVTFAVPPAFSTTPPLNGPTAGFTAVIVWLLPSRVNPSGIVTVSSVVQSSSRFMVVPTVVNVQVVAALAVPTTVNSAIENTNA